MGTKPLSIDVYVAPMRPYACPDQLGEGEVATWEPSSSTLISGPTELQGERDQAHTLWISARAEVARRA